MATDVQSSGVRGVVVAHVLDQGEHDSRHERVTLREFARRLAALRGDEDGGEYDPRRSYAGRLYFVPSDTLTAEQAAALGIRGPDDLLGGVVPHCFVGSKAISHPLLAGGATSLEGWNPRFSEQVGDAVLAGYAVFSPDDARRAGLELLRRGPVRLKPVRASGGRGQHVVRDGAALQALLAAMDEAEIRDHGLVLEEDLVETLTFSVGQVCTGDLSATYFGVQKLTCNNQGHEVYGGSDLTVVRGDYEALLAICSKPDLRLAIEQARRYDAAVRDCFPGFYATRSNYDILQGRDAGGSWRSGVLEQSWRVGGATGGEIAALEAFRADPRRSCVRTCGVEVFGDSPEPPAHATVYFRGTDPRAGRMTKYSFVQEDDDTRQDDRHRGG
ncbi:MAG TPA: DUF3182 family protein [Ramlibacter sp.]|nr:DUF3182 family protein [Ramlibacter sp.]